MPFLSWCLVFFFYPAVRTLWPCHDLRGQRCYLQSVSQRLAQKYLLVKYTTIVEGPNKRPRWKSGLLLAKCNINIDSSLFQHIAPLLWLTWASPGLLLWLTSVTHTHARFLLFVLRVFFLKTTPILTRTRTYNTHGTSACPDTHSLGRRAHLCRWKVDAVNSSAFKHNSIRLLHSYLGSWLHTSLNSMPVREHKQFQTYLLWESCVVGSKSDSFWCLPGNKWKHAAWFWKQGCRVMQNRFRSDVL